MMKKSIFCYFLLFFSLTNTVSAQSDTLKGKDITPKLAQRAVNNHFSRFITSQENSGLNNSVNYETKDNRLTLNGAVPFKEQTRYLTLKLSGGITDGISTLFSESKLNKNTEVEARLHFLKKNNWSVILAENALFYKQKRQLEVEYEYKKDSVIIHYQENQRKLDEVTKNLKDIACDKKKIEEKNQVKIRIISLQDQIEASYGRLERVTKKLDRLRLDRKKLDNLKEEPVYSEKLAKYRKDSTKYKAEFDSLHTLRDSLVTLCDASEMTLVERLGFRGYYRVTLKPITFYDSLIILYTRKQDSLSHLTLKQQLKKVEERETKALDNLIGSFNLDEISLNWVTFSGGISNRSFRHFDDTTATPYNKQIRSLSFVSPHLSLEFHKVQISNFSNGNSFYRIWKFSLLTTDNFESLTKHEINENRKIIGPDSTQERIIHDKFNAYSGEYLKDIFTIKANFDWYQLISKKQSFGFHLFPELIMKKSLIDMNAGVGLFMNFLDTGSKENPKPLVALEFFLGCNQMLQKGKLRDKLGGGIKIGIPINFKQI